MYTASRKKPILYMIKTVILLIMLLMIVQSTNAACPHAAGGLTTWSSLTIPSSGVINLPNLPVLVDVNVNVSTQGVVVQNQLIFPDAERTFDARFIKVLSGGYLLAGASDCRIQNNVTITLWGSPGQAGHMGTDPMDNIALGDKGIAISGGAHIELWGRLPNPTWTMLSMTANAGASTISLKKSVNWLPGQKIVIASTDFHGEGYHPHQTEERTIVAVSGNVVTLDAPLQYMHWGAGNQFAEVGLLSRSIVIKGDWTSESNGFGAQLMIRKATTVKIDAVEFTKMGQQGVVGRYPVHFHLSNQHGAGMSLKHSSIHHNFQRCVVVHDTDGTLVDNNVAYHTQGHCMFYEDGSEMDNVMTNNLAIDAFPVPAGLTLIVPTDRKPTVYWITNPNNTMTGNHAVGGRFGFWWAFPDKPNGLSTSKYANTKTIWPRFMPFRNDDDFHHNVAHGASENGFHLDDFQNADGTTATKSFTPRIGPYDTAILGAGETVDAFSWKLTPKVSRMHNLLAYKCRSHGIWTRSSYTEVYDSIVEDNTFGVLFVPGPNFLRDSTIVGETDNIGTVVNPSWLPAVTRSRPVYWNSNYPIAGFGHYDAGGPQLVRNVTFKNFVNNNLRIASAHSTLPNGPNLLLPMNRMSQLQYDSQSNRFHIHFWPNAWSTSKMKDAMINYALFDVDGSTTGNQGTWVVSNHSMNWNPVLCEEKSGWNVFTCRSDGRHRAMIGVRNQDKPNTNFGTTVTGNEYYRAQFFALGDTEKKNPMNVVGQDPDDSIRTTYTMNALLRTGYQIEFDHPTPPKVRLEMNGAAEGEWVVLVMAYPAGTTFTVTTGYGNAAVTKVDSLDKLTSRFTYFWDSDSNHLYIRLEQDSLSSSNVFDHTFHSSHGAYTNVQASCNGGGCLTGAIRVKPSLVAYEQPYRADMCDTSKVESSTAFVRMDPRTFKSQLYVTHSLNQNDIASVTLEHTDGTVYRQLAGVSSPMRSSMMLSRTVWSALYSGDLNVKITPKSGAALVGKIGCRNIATVGCKAPQPIPTTNPCASVANSISVVTNGAQETGWSDWSYGNQKHSWSVGTNQPLCTGQTVAYVSLMDGALSMHKDNTPITLNPNNIGFLEFFVRQVAVGDHGVDSLPVRLMLRLRTGPGVDLAWAEVKPVHIDQIVIDKMAWSRVRVSLSDLGVTGTTTIQLITLQRYNPWETPGTNHTMIVDNMRFIPTPGANEAKTTEAASTAASFYGANACVANPPDNPNMPTPTPSPSDNKKEEDKTKTPVGPLLTPEEEIIVAASAGGGGLILIIVLVLAFVPSARKKIKSWFSGEDKVIKQFERSSAQVNRKPVEMNSISAGGNAKPMMKRTAPPPPQPRVAQNTVKALYAYAAQGPGELSINPGDVIVVEQVHGDGWTTGSKNGQKGAFPSNYVQ
eukprot:TRINITY_DN1606_c1_g1_i1.p1 TRINITY_DN1606_c1_g1~~TRINITY_DN1606_c1_g1_i1.p1  ORF type:complete len:1405 (-),score=404.75 TRINITY_DN1606_c1_g1_i1:73-4287(-)